MPNQGQLKHFAAKAAAELNADLVGGAGTAINDLILSWSEPNASRDDYAAVNQGQLKAVAKLFYDRLIETAYTQAYPWSLAATDDDNYAAANIGQVKYLFSFDLETFEAPAAPGNLNALENEDGSVELTWVDSSENESGFIIQRSDDGGQTWITLQTTAANTSSYTVPANSAGVFGVSKFRITAANGAGSTFSSTVTSGMKSPLLAPENFLGQMDKDGKISLSWGEVPKAASYVVERKALSDGSAWEELAVVTGTTHETSGDGSGYRYRIHARRPGVNSAPSDEFPRARYIAVEVGSGIPLYFNNKGSVLLNTGTVNAPGYKLWQAGTLLDIPAALLEIKGLNNLDTVVGTVLTGDEISMTGPVLGQPSVTVSKAATWSPTGSLQAYSAELQVLQQWPDSTGLPGGLPSSPLRYGFGGSAINDSAVFGPASGAFWDYDNEEEQTDPIAFGWITGTVNFTTSQVVGGLGSENTLGISPGGAPSGFPGSGNNYLPNTAEMVRFFPWKVTNSGRMLGYFYRHLEGGVNYYGDGGLFYGGSLTELMSGNPETSQNFSPSDVNEAGIVVGYDHGTSAYRVLNGQTLGQNQPIQINNAAQAQILTKRGTPGDSWLWTFNSTEESYKPLNIAALIHEEVLSTFQSFNATGINDHGLIVGTATKVRDENGDSITPVSKVVILIPIELKDIQGNGEADDRVIETIPRKGQNESDNDYLQRPLSDRHVAFIEPHRGADNTPDMPRLVARLPESPQGLKVKWRLEVDYERGNGWRAPYIQNWRSSEDLVRIPAAGQGGTATFTDEMDANQDWRIFESQAWQTEIGQHGFFGGTGKLYLWFPGQTVPTEPIITFRIGGRNPVAATAKQFINQVVSEVDNRLWFAYAIAKEESHNYGGPDHEFYNQFFADYRRQSGNGWDTNMDWQCWAKAWPAYNLDRNSRNGPQNGPGGYGIFQVTGSATDENAIIPRRQIWNWQDNVRAGIAIIRSKAQFVDPRNTALLATYPGSGALPGYPIGYTGTRRLLSGWDAYVCTAYNGFGGTRRIPMNDYSKDQWTCWNPKAAGWNFIHNSNRYCERIFEYIEETQ